MRKRSIVNLFIFGQIVCIVGDLKPLYIASNAFINGLNWKSFQCYNNTSYNGLKRVKTFIDTYRLSGYLFNINLFNSSRYGGVPLCKLSKFFVVVWLKYIRYITTLVYLILMLGWLTDTFDKMSLLDSFNEALYSPSKIWA